MNIKISNCNSIENTELSIQEGKINIKFGINGTGKSTVAKAIQLSCEDKINGTTSLKGLKPFKYRSVDGQNPSVVGVDDINNVLVFSEDYINQYVFQQDELLKNSFQIFIKDSRYESGLNEINHLMKSIKKTFSDSKEIDNLVQDLNELLGCFGKSKGLSKASSIVKGFGIGNKIDEVPKSVTGYKDFIQHEENTKWLSWQLKGSDFLEVSSCCPYCTSGIEEKKETILAVKDEYDPKLIQHLNKVIDVVERLSVYFSDDAYSKILDLSKSIRGIKKEQETFLLEVREQIRTLIDKLHKLKYLSFETLKDIGKVIEALDDFKIEMDYLQHLKSESTLVKVGEINQALDAMKDKAGILQGEVNKQKKYIKETIEMYNGEINSFLSSAGYRYNVTIIDDEDQTYKMVIRHNDFNAGHIDKPTLHLSFGERNAFALVLFMFEAVRKNPEIIILDDPISSFDNNKKFAIVNMLFRGEKSLRGKTVLMLTHDIAPVVDMVHHIPHIFDRPPVAHFLENENGGMIEKLITKSDIKTFIEVAKENIDGLSVDINKLIFLRRLYEINNDKGLGFQLLSNLFHKREVPRYITLDEDRDMVQEEINDATIEIREYVPNFEYHRLHNEVMNEDYIKGLYEQADSNYEKLQLFRIINNDSIDNIVISKYVKETFHIENDYMYQLNPCNFMTVPYFIINECDKALGLIDDSGVEEVLAI